MSTKYLLIKGFTAWKCTQNYFSVNEKDKNKSQTYLRKENISKCQFLVEKKSEEQMLYRDFINMCKLIIKFWGKWFYFSFRRFPMLWIKEFSKTCNDILEEKTWIRHFKHYYFILCFPRSLLKIDFIKDRKWHHPLEKPSLWRSRSLKQEEWIQRSSNRKKKRTLINKSVWNLLFFLLLFFLICTFRVAQLSSVSLFHISGGKLAS